MFLIQKRNILSEKLVTELLKFLEDLRWGPVKLLSQNSLLVEFQVAEHLTEVTVNHIFDRCVHASEHDMIATTEWLRLNSQIHFKMREKVNIFSCLEGNKSLQSTHRCGNEDQLLGSVWI